MKHFKHIFASLALARTLFVGAGRALPLLALLSTAAQAQTTINMATVSTGGAGYTYASNTVTITAGGDYLITGTTTDKRVVVNNVTANITLQSVSITGRTGDDEAPITVKSGANVTITLTGDNTLTAQGANAGLRVEPGATLTITSASSGKLTATGSFESYKGGGAGIGGMAIANNTAISTGTINIQGNAVIVAQGGDRGAGIGSSGDGTGAYNSLTYTGTVNISENAHVTASGGGFSPGIGSGNDVHTNNGTVNISGGTVIANSRGYSAGIGGGTGGGGGTVNITGGVVTANGDGNGKAIGPGGGGSGGTFDMSGSAIVFTNANGVVDNGNRTSGILVVNGDLAANATVTGSCTVPSGKDFTIPSGKTLTVANGVTLTNNATITNSGTIILVGTGNITPNVPGGTYKYKPVITTSSLPGGTGGTAYSQTLAASCGSTVVWTISAGSLPAGLSITAGNTISGTPTAAGNATFTVRATCGDQTDEKQLSINITAGVPDAPTGLSADATSVSGQVALSWTAPSNDGGAAITGYDYSSNDGGTWTGTGSTNTNFTVTGLIGGQSYTFKVRAVNSAGNGTASASATATPKYTETTPSAQIDFAAEQLTNLVASAWYLIGGSSDRQAGGDGKIAIDATWLGNPSLSIVKKGGAASVNSAAQNLNIPARRNAPTVSNVNETVAGRNDGQITGITVDMEYNTTSATHTGSWTAYAAPNAFAPAKYYVRLKSTNAEFVSAVATVTIGTDAAQIRTLSVTPPTFSAETYGYTRPAAKDITITNTGNFDVSSVSVTLSGANAGAFELTGSGSTVAYGGSITTWKVQPNASLDAGTYTATIEVSYNGTSGNLATNTVTFTVDKKTPDVTWPAGLTLTYGEALSSISFGTNAGATPGKFAWTGAVGNTKPDVSDSQLTNYNVTFTPTDETNYTTASDNVQVTVNPKPLTISGTVTATKVYDGNVNFDAAQISIGAATLDGVVAGDESDVSIDKTAATVTLGSANVVSNTALTGAGFALAGSKAGNYALSAQPTVSASITQATLTITPRDGQGKVYNTSDPTLNYQATGWKGSDDETLLDGALARDGGDDVNTYAINIGDLHETSGNYAISFVGSKTFAITQAPAPSINYPSSTTITYGQTLSASSLTGGSTTFGDFAWTNPETVPPVANTGYSVTFTPNAATERNYQTITPTTSIVSLTVNAKDVAAAAVQIAGTYIYNGTPQTPAAGNVTVTLAGFGTLANGTDYGYALTDGGTDVGTATVTVTGAGNFTGTATGTFEILPNIKNGIVIAGDTASMPATGQFVFTFPEKMDTATVRTVTIRNSWDGTTAELTGYFLNDSVTFVVDYRRLDFRTDYTLALSGFYNRTNQHIYEQTFAIVTQDYPPAPAIARYITLPAVSGVVMQPAAGSHRIQSGSDFVFTLTPPAGTVPHVTTDRLLGGAPETLKGTQNADGSYTFVIRDVRENITVSITFATGNEAVGASSLKVWPNPVPRGGTARLEYNAPDNTEVRIYTVQGTLVSIQKLHNGQAMLTFPPVAGVYVVKVAGKTVKAIVN